MAETEKEVEDPNFKPGVMSPKSKQTFSSMRNFQPIGKNKLILDENTFEDRFLRCGICKELYNQTDRSPRLLPCHHCFCITCVLHFYYRDEEERQRIMKGTTDILCVITVKCPTCYNSFVSTLEGLHELVADHRVIQLLDFVGTTDKQSIEYCPKHLTQPVNFFCESCVVRICRDCLVIDHKPCSDDKLVLDLKSAYQKYEPVLASGVKEMEDEVKALTDRKVECETAKVNYKRPDESMIAEIKESCDRLRKALDEREAKLIEMAKESVGVVEFDFEKKSKVYDEKEVEVKELQSLIKDATSTDNLLTKFNVYTKLKRYSTEPALRTDEYEHKQDQISSFNKTDESLLTTKISRFGDIESKPNTSSLTYGRSSSIENNKTGNDSKTESSYTGSSSSGSSYVSSLGSYPSGTGRSSSYGSYLSGSSLYGSNSGSTYTSRYTPRSYRY